MRRPPGGLTGSGRPAELETAAGSNADSAREVTAVVLVDPADDRHDEARAMTDRQQPGAHRAEPIMPSAAEKASTMGHHDHGLNSPSSGSPSSMSAVQDVLGEVAALGDVHAPDVERDEGAHRSSVNSSATVPTRSIPWTTPRRGAMMFHPV